MPNPNEFIKGTVEYACTDAALHQAAPFQYNLALDYLKEAEAPDLDAWAVDFYRVRAFVLLNFAAKGVAGPERDAARKLLQLLKRSLTKEALAMTTELVCEIFARIGPAN